MKPPTKKAKLAAINEILVLNARSIGQPQRIFATPLAGGWIRIGGQYQSRKFADIDTALAEAWKALERAKAQTGDPCEHRAQPFTVANGSCQCLICGNPVRTAGESAIHAQP